MIDKSLFFFQFHSKYYSWNKVKQKDHSKKPQKYILDFRHFYESISAVPGKSHETALFCF